MTNSKPEKAKPIRLTRTQTLIILIFGGIFAYLIWNTESLSFIAYPFRLFVTYIHEAGHSLAALLTGGQVVQFTVSPNGSGLALTSGGSRFAILPAGYLGASLFGSGLFYLLYRHPHPRTYSILIGSFLIIFTILYARPDASGAWTALVVGIVFGLLLIGMAWKATPYLTQLLLTVLALLTATNALLDVHYLTQLGDGQCGAEMLNDAQQMACLFGISATFWAVMWMGIAVLMLGASVYFSLVYPFTQGLPKKLEKAKAPIPTTPKPKSKPDVPRPPAKEADDPLKNLKRDADGEVDFSQFT